MDVVIQFTDKMTDDSDNHCLPEQMAVADLAFPHVPSRQPVLAQSCAATHRRDEESKNMSNPTPRGRTALDRDEKRKGGMKEKQHLITDVGQGT